MQSKKGNGDYVAANFEELKRIDCHEVAHRLGLEVNRSGKARCFHSPGDNNPSLQIYNDGWKCFRCGTSGDQVDLVSQYSGITSGEAVKWLEREFNIQQPPKKQDYGKLEREHIYPGGKCKKNIYRREDGSKYACWFHAEGNQWKKGRNGMEPGLYATETPLPADVYIVEGEKDVDTMKALGYAAASFPDGAKSKWRPEYGEALKGRRVTIIQDNDEPGKEFVQRIAGELHGLAQSVKVLDLSAEWPDIPEHGDVSDMVAAFGDEGAAAMVVSMERAAPEWIPEEKKQSVFGSFGFYTVPDLTEEERKPPEFIIEGMIPCGMSFLSGAPKIRKSFMALQMEISVATGQPFLGHSTLQCDVAYFDLEGSKSRISTRADRMSVKIPRNVFITNEITERLADGLIDKIQWLHRERPSIRFIVIDTYSRARGSYKTFGANAYDADVSLLEPVQRMAIEENIAILFIHHDKKGAGFAADSFERMSGTMGISGSADSVLNLIADGKRFDGKATLEYTPRDAKGGEINLVFDERFGEWQEVVELSKQDIRGNPICDWIISNAPEKGKLGEFIPYDDIFKYAYRFQANDSGEKVREQLESRRNELFTTYGIGVQLGVKSNSKRGIRIINLL